MKNEEDSAGYVTALRVARVNLTNSARICRDGEKAARERGDALAADRLKGEARGFSVVANMIYEVLNRSVDDWGKIAEAYGARGGTAYHSPPASRG